MSHEIIRYEYEQCWSPNHSAHDLCRQAASDGASILDIIRALHVIHEKGGRSGEEWLEKIEAAHPLDLLSLEHPKLVKYIEACRSVRTVHGIRIIWRSQTKEFVL